MGDSQAALRSGQEGSAFIVPPPRRPVQHLPVAWGLEFATRLVAHWKASQVPFRLDDR